MIRRARTGVAWACALALGACADAKPRGGRAGGGAAGAAHPGGPGDPDGDGAAPGGGGGEGDGAGADGAALPDDMRLSVSPNPTRAGDSAEVLCVVSEAAGVVAPERIAIDVSPPDAVELDGVRIRTERAGDYEVRCVVDGGARQGTVGWRVDPAVAARLTVRAEPEIVRSGDAVTVEVGGSDAYGNALVPALEWRIDGGPDHGVTPLRNGKLRLVGSGWAVVTGTDAESGLAVAFDVGVDRDPPRIEITSPGRAAFIPSPAPVKVEGRVLDDVGVAWALVGDEPVAPGPDGDFSVALPDLRAGLHIVASEAEDLAGRGTEGAQAFLWGDFGGPGGWTPGALRIGVGRTFLDDDDPDLDDVAGLAEAFVRSRPLVPDRLPLSECGGWMELSNLRHRPAAVDLVPVVGGVAATVTVRDLEVDYTGEYCQNVFLVGCQCLAFHGTAAASSVTADTSASLWAADCRPVVSPSPADVEVAGLDVRLGGLASLLNPVIGLFQEAIRERMEEAIAEQADALLGGALEGLLDSLALPDALPLPPPLQGELPLDTCFSEVAFDPDGGHLDADTRSPVDTAIALPANAGPLRTAGAAERLHGPAALGLAVDDDLLNALLFDAWRAGLLDDVDLLALMGGGAAEGPLPIPVQALRLTALLPPVLRPVSADGGAVVMELALGDLLVRAGTEVGDIVAAVSVVLPATGRIDGARIEIAPDPDPVGVVLELEVLEAPELGGFDALLGALEELFIAQALPLLGGRTFGLDLPAIPLDALLPGEGAALTVSRPVLSLPPPGGHLTVRADLAAAP